ncbi:MAG TPA: hypothetical protein VGI00_13590 [Streptosporangiaceae bacterium]
MTDDGLLTEMQALRNQVTGITGAAVASRDAEPAPSVFRPLSR